MMFRLLESLFGKSKFYPFETMILEKVLSRIEGENVLRLKQQIGVINYIQRHREGREVNFYQMQNGKVIFDNNLRFPDSPEEEMLARVILRSPTETTELKAEIWMTGGRIFSLEFDKRPKQYFSGIRLQDARPEITEVVVCNGYS
jgi:hypothetical protein